MDTPGHGHSLDRIGELIAALDRLADPDARASMRELLQFILEVHGSALARFMELAAEESGRTGLLDRAMQDKDVEAVLLLHGLHPQGLAARVQRAVEGLRAQLGVRGIAIDALEVVESAVRLRLAVNAMPAAQADPAALRREIQEAIFDAAPDVAEIEIDGLPSIEIAVPLASIGGLHKSGGPARRYTE